VTLRLNVPCAMFKVRSYWRTSVVAMLTGSSSTRTRTMVPSGTGTTVCPVVASP
jgi:hypothetical protein